MSTENHGRPEGWDAPVPDDAGGWHVQEPTDIGGGVQDAAEAEAVPAGSDAERLRSDDIAQTGLPTEGVVGDSPALTEAERIRSDDIAEPAGLPEDVVGDDPTLTEAERIRSDEIVEPGGVEETQRFDGDDRLDYEDPRRVDRTVEPPVEQPAEHDQTGD